MSNYNNVKSIERRMTKGKVEIILDDIDENEQFSFTADIVCPNCNETLAKLFEYEFGEFLDFCLCCEKYFTVLIKSGDD